MAKFFNVSSWSATILFFAICISATQSEYNYSSYSRDNSWCRWGRANQLYENSTYTSYSCMHDRNGWRRLYRCYENNTHTSYSCMCTYRLPYRCCENNTYTTDLHPRQTHCWYDSDERSSNIDAPKFNSTEDGPYDVNLNEGESVTFNCNTIAIPEATIFWYLYGEPIDINNASERFAFSNNKKTLTIRNVCRNCTDRTSQTNRMVIECTAYNVHGFAHAYGHVNVFRRTKVSLPGSTLVIVNLTTENQFHFNCSATSDPRTPPTVRWYRVGPHGQESVYTETPYVYVMNGNLAIKTDPNCTTCDKYLGEYRCVGDNGYSRDVATVTLSITNKVCDEERDELHSILWNHTLAGKDISRPCPGNAIGNCTRKCFMNNAESAKWSSPNCNSCFEKRFKKLLEQVDQLEATELNQTAIANIASQLSAFTNRSDVLTAGNLNATVLIINRLAVFRSNKNNSLNENEIKSVVQSISNILQPNNSKAWKELKTTNSSVASAILFSAEVYAQSLSKIHNSTYSIEKADSLVLEAWSLKKSNLPQTFEFPTRSDENNGDRISLSMETLKKSISTGSTLNIWGLYYRTINDYLPGNKDTDINSRVLSLSFGGLKANEKLMKPVIVTLEHKQAKRISFQRTCSFWNFDSGEWDSTGCSVTSTNVTHTICSCDHLTNFAILMSRYPSYDKALSVLSLVGCSISVIALTLTVITYSLTWKQIKSAQATVLLNLCVALIIAYVIFMAGADKVDSQNGCKAVAILLHYFFLAAFFIMLAEGVELLLYIIFVFHARRSIETFLLLATAWAIPIVIVAISAGSTHAEGYGGDRACWLSANRGLIWAFVAPVLCVMTVNFVILAIVLRRMCQARTFMAKNEKKIDEIRATIWNLSVTCPVLGLGWLFGILSVAFDSPVFQYLFVIANSLQGLLIFIFHVLFHNKKMGEKISYFYAHYICRCRTSDSSQSTSSQGGPAQKPPKRGLVARTIQHFEGIGVHYYSTSTQNASVGESSTIESAQ